MQLSHAFRSLRLKLSRGLRKHRRSITHPNIGTLSAGQLSVVSFHSCEDGVSIEESETPSDGDEAISTEMFNESRATTQNRRELRPPFTMPSGERNARFHWDILSEIFEWVAGEFYGGKGSEHHQRWTIQPSLRNFTLVCQAWYWVASHMLFKGVVVSSRSLAPFANAIRKYPYLRPMVRLIRFEPGAHSRPKMTPSMTNDLRTVQRLCTKLSGLYLHRPPNVSVCCDRQIINSIGIAPCLIKTLTHLDIKLHDGMPCGSRLLFSSSLSLPALKELTIDVSHHDCPLSKGVPTQHWIEWPRMPQLSKICMRDWYGSHTGSCLSFPLHCDKLRAVEIVDGFNYHITADFWACLLPYRRSLESLTITTGMFAVPEYKKIVISLEGFSSLTELHIPLTTFANCEDIRTHLPFDSLRGLVITGDYEFERVIIVRAEQNLFSLLLSKSQGVAMKSLGFIDANFKSPWIEYLGERGEEFPGVSFQRVVVQAVIAGVELQLWRPTVREAMLRRAFRGFMYQNYARIHGSGLPTSTF